VSRGPPGDRLSTIGGLLQRHLMVAVSHRPLLALRKDQVAFAFWPDTAFEPRYTADAAKKVMGCDGESSSQASEA
jgi:hypothetical protein